MATPLQSIDNVIYISYSANTPGEGMSSTILPSGMSKYWYRMGSLTLFWPLQSIDNVIYISNSANTPGEGMSSTILPSGMSKYWYRMGSLTLFWPLVKKKENSEFNLVKHCIHNHFHVMLISRIFLTLSPSVPTTSGESSRLHQVSTQRLTRNHWELTFNHSRWSSLIN